MSRTPKEKLFKVLLDNAKALPGAGGNVTDDIQGLEAILLGAAKAKFLKDYQVDFNGNATRPKDLATGKEPNVRAATALYYLPDNDPPDLKTFIEKQIFSFINFTRPDVKSFANEAYSTLEKELTQKLNASTGNNWLSAAFSQTYKSRDSNENSLRTISVLFYTNAELKEGSSTAKMKFISYLGVYYHVPGPREQLLTKLLAKWYDNAGRLYNPPKQFAPPYTTAHLVRILEDYSRFKFKDIFDVEYVGDSTKPKDLIPSPWALASNSATIIILDNKWGDLKDTINFEIVLGLTIPEWLGGDVLAELSQTFLLVKDFSMDGSINSTMSTKTYRDPTSPQRFDWKSLFFLTFSNGTASEDGVTVTRTFINFIGVIYPINPIGVV